ncbi:hypothetical protein AX15_007667 [Amanita polypyramis BW_CC]|nr:hypothetical protein AX15_007667 [Amanita polypyramis BW_CC]
MRFLVPASLLAIAARAFADSESDVLSLTTSNFDELVNPEPLILVEFFAPWCGHCKALAPNYEEAATVLKEKNIKLAKVDCVEEAELCQSKGVQGYPTLKVYKNGEVKDYAGSRQADGIVSYMIKQSLPAVSDVTAATHSEFQKADKVVAIAYLSSPTDAPAAQFHAAAEAHRDEYLFGLTTDKDAIEAAGISPPSVIVYRAFDEPRLEYPYPVSALTSDELSGWLAELSIPLLDEVNAENYRAYATSQKPLGYLFLDPTSEKKEELIEAIRPVAKKYKSKLNFVWIDAVQYGDHGKALNLGEQKWPAFVIQELTKQLKYPLDQSKEVTVETVSELVQLYVEGKIEPTLKSEPIPESQDEPVYVIVGKNFEQIVLDDSKDVFIEFYATWCGHCKRLKPTWDSLAERFADRKDRIVIAKMEATENDFPPSVDFHVGGFPTIKFKPAGSRNFIDYNGDRSLESFVDFIEEHAKNSLESPVAPAEDQAQTPLVQPTPEAEESSHDEL